MTTSSSHPAIDPEAVARLRRRLGRPESTEVPDPGAAMAETGPVPPPTPTQAALSKAKVIARRAAAPVVARARHELAEAAGREQDSLRAEVAALRDELERTRAELGAEIAALHEELRGADGGPARLEGAGGDTGPEGP